MLAHAEDPVSQHDQQMFYLYGADVLKMHAELTSAGVTCSSIESPFYAPRGEFRVEDPDGYVLMFTHSD